MRRRVLHAAWILRRALFIVTGLGCLMVLSAASQTPSGNQSAAPVQLDGRNVLEIQWGYKTFTPESRAVRISRLLKQIGNDSSAPRFSLETEVSTVDIVSGDMLVAAVFEGDAKAAGVSREQLAAQWAAAMQSAVDTYRHEHSLRLKLMRLLLALLLVAVCLAVLAVLQALGRRLTTLAHTALEERAATTDRRLAVFIGHEKTHRFVIGALNFARLVLSLLVAWVTLHLALSVFPRTRSFSERMQESFLNPIRRFGNALLGSLPSLVFVILVVIVTWYLTKFIHFFFQRVREGAITLEGFRPFWAPTTDRLVSIAVAILAVLVAYPYIPGAESPAFKGVSLFLGVLVSLGSTGLVANAVNGISLTYLDAFEVGDLVKIGDVEGWITKMGMLTTRVRTRKNENITIPNSVVMNKEIINFHQPNETDVTVSSKVGIGYDVPWRQVEAILKLAARRTRGICSSPDPVVLELSLNTFDITYEVDAPLEPGQLFYRVASELNRNILDAFNEFGVQIMTPAYMADPQHDKVVPRERWHQAPARADVSDTDPGGSKAAD